MNKYKNPFSPGAGSPPPELAGRDDILEQADVLLGRVLAGRSEKSILMTGLRGVGKTVLLNAIARKAKDAGYKIIQIEASEDKSLAALLAPNLRRLLFELDRLAGAKENVRKGFAVLKGFLGAVKMTVGELEFGLDIEPEHGFADSGDLSVDLPNLFEVVAEAAQERETGIALLIDEIQFLDSKELSALVMAMHRMQQQQLPLVLIAAGLPILPKLMGDAKSYSERLFSYPIVGPLPEPSAAKALNGPVEVEGVRFTDDALKQVFTLTRGYPYFLQEWGYQAWNRAETSPIGPAVVEDATIHVMTRLDENFFRVRYDRCTPGEKKFLRAMAQLGTGPYSISDIAGCLNRQVKSLGPTRNNLINKGMVFSPAHGGMDFTVPLFDEFMRRTMPTFGTED